MIILFYLHMNELLFVSAEQTWFTGRLLFLGFFLAPGVLLEIYLFVYERAWF